jgi:hypothetical protein
MTTKTETILNNGLIHLKRGAAFGELKFYLKGETSLNGWSVNLAVFKEHKGNPIGNPYFTQALTANESAPNDLHFTGTISPENSKKIKAKSAVCVIRYENLSAEFVDFFHFSMKVSPGGLTNEILNS